MIRKNLEKIMKTLFISFITLLFFSASLQADVVTGIFQTEKNEEGNYFSCYLGLIFGKIHFCL